jgi:hypothetical protein
MKRESVGVFKGSPKSWQSLGEKDSKPVEPVSTREFSVHWGTQPETRPTPNSVEPVFEKLCTRLFLIELTGILAGQKVAERTVQKPVEAVFEIDEQVLRKLKWTKVKLKWGVKVVFPRAFMI